jgi:hypothetical protein
MHVSRVKFPLHLMDMVSHFIFVVLSMMQYIRVYWVEFGVECSVLGGLVVVVGREGREDV